MQSSNFALLPSIAAIVVGLTFVWSGAIKAISPHVFAEHLNRLGAIPRKWTSPAVVVAAGFEVGWGIALIVGVARGIVLPATALLLVAFTTVSWWGVKSGRTTDCGCYGGYVVPSVEASVAVNSVFIALVLLAYTLGGAAIATPAWKIIAAISAAAIGASVAAAGHEFVRKHGRFMIDMSPLRVGRRWRDRWGAPIDDDREHLISYLGPDCPHCKQWVRVLNAVDQSQGLPAVTGIVATTADKLDNFVQTSGIRFPMRTIPQSLMSRLVWGVPTTVLVANGVIQNTWIGRMPPEFFQRFKEAFFPGSGGSSGTTGAADVDKFPFATRST